MKRSGLSFFFVVFLSFFGFGFWFDDIVFGAFGGWSGRLGCLSWLSWLDWLGINDRGGNSVTFGSERSIALNEENDAFDEAPNTATHDSNVRDEHEEAKEEAQEWDVGGQSDHDGGKHDEEEAATGQSDMDEAFLFLTEIPVVGAESAEEDAEQASGDGRFDASWDGVLEGGVVEWVA